MKVLLQLAFPLVILGHACDCDPEPITATKCEFVVTPSGEGNEITFNATAVNDESSRAWRLENTGSGVSLVDIEVTFESVNGEHYRVEIPADTRIAPGGEETFTVVFRPQAEALLASRFVVSHPDVGNARCNTQTVFVRGTGFRPQEVDAGFPDAGFEDAGFLDGGPDVDAGSVETPDAGVVLPPGGQWFAYGAFEEARAGFAAFELKDGTGDVVAIGGFGEDGVALDSIERLNVVTGVSRVVARMAVPRAEPAAAMLADGKIVIFGGRSGAVGGLPLRTVEQLDPLVDTLTCLDTAGCGLEAQENAALSTGRIGAVAHTLANGNVALLLGRTFDALGNEVALAGGEVVDVTGPLSSSTIGGNALLTARIGTAQLVDGATGSLLIIGGRNGAGNVLADVLRLDAATSTVTSLPDLELPRAFAAAAVLSEAPNAGDVIVAGGFAGTGAGVVEVERIDDAFAAAGAAAVIDELVVAPRVGGSLLTLQGDILLWTGGMRARVDHLDVDDSVVPQTDAEVIVPIGATAFLRFATDNELAQGRFDHQALVVGLQRDSAVFLGGLAVGPRRTPQPHVERYVLEDNRFVTFGLMGSGTALEAGLVAGSGAALVSAGGIDPHTGRTSGAVRAFDATNGIYVEAGELNQPRRDHTLTRVSVNDDQTLLVAGGRDESGAVLGSLSFVDPVNQVDRPLPIGLRVARAGHTATRLLDGNPIALGAVLICGGQGPGGEALDSCEIVVPPSNPRDPATFDEALVLTVLGRLSAGRVSHTATLLESGEVLIVGGGDVSVDLVNADLVIADDTDSFVRATGQPVLARRDHASVFLGSGRVLVVGGDVSDGAGGVGATDQAELYVRASETFIAVATMEQQRSAPGAFLLGNGDVLVAGGARLNATLGVPSRSNNTSELYVVNGDGTGTFESLDDTPLSFGRSDVLFIDVFGRAMVAGGTHRDGVLSTGDERKTPLTFVDWLEDPALTHQP
jgi:hypothetical protein